jgi:uncharacterized protein (DUF1330 family)
LRFRIADWIHRAHQKENQRTLVLHHPIPDFSINFLTLLTNPFLANAMTHYFAAQIRIHDPEEYEKYLENFDEIFSQYKGEYLAIDESPTVLEGKWDYTKSVLVKFSSRQDFEDWYYSEDYQRILKHRLNASDCDTILLEGLD